MKRTLLPLLVLLSSSLYGQVSGRIVGAVVDATGGAVPDAGVSVRLRGSDGGLFAGTSSSDGTFSISGVRPETYDIVIEKAGFQTAKIAALRVDGGRDTVMPPVRLDIASVAQAVEVIGAVESVQTVSPAIATTLRSEQIQALPMVNRSPLAFLVTQAGVNSGAGSTTINGLRTSYNTMTFEGVNTQDNFIRTNDLDFQPNRLTLDAVAEMTVKISNADVGSGMGAGQVTISAPSGKSSYHGEAFWTNRNNYFAANNWFNNRDGIARPFLNQNQIGANFGGPILKDKLFFFVKWEMLRNRQQAARNRTILTDGARSGNFTYLVGGAPRTVNLLTVMQTSPDPFMQNLLSQVPAGSKANNFRLGDSTESLLRNTIGYSYLQRNNNDRDTGLLKFDFSPTVKHAFAVTTNINRDTLDRGDQTNEYTVIPSVSNDSKVKLLATMWRWSPSARMTNELRWGFNWAPGRFDNSTQYDKFQAVGMSYSNPINQTLRTQGRNTDTYNLSDNFSYERGRHSLQFGMLGQWVAVQYYDEAGLTPRYTIGTGTGNPNLTATQLPGINATDLAAANLLFASLAGYVTSYTQTFQVASRTSGFVNGQQLLRNLQQSQFSFYGQDRWKMARGLMVTAGLSWTYLARVNERDSLGLLPVLKNNNAVTTLTDPNGVFDFAGNSVGRPWYKKDLNNFAPGVGFAWDPFNSSKTSIRGSYTMAYVNDEHMTALNNSSVATNAGLSSTVARTGIAGRVTGALPPIAVPTLKVPRTYADNYALDPASAVATVDPNLATPYVQQWSFGIQHEIKRTIFEVRYIGNHATKQFRAFDFNQVDIKSNGFLPDFIRAQNNGFLAQRATGTFNANYNPQIAGSQPLTVFPLLAQGGLLTNGTIVGLLQQGQAGELANTYQTNGLQGSVNFYRNYNALGNNLMTNYSNASYNGLQAEMTRKSGNLQYQINYTYAKVMSDAAGDSQARFEAFLDAGNAKIERSRVQAFDLTHVLKGNFVYNLPFGEGQRWSKSGWNRVIGGWQISGIVNIQSGAPFSILSGRGTLNRGARSTTTNTAVTALNKEQLDELIGFRMTGTGPYMFPSSAIGPDGRAVAADGAAPFAGQVFFQPTAGNIGTLQRNYFDGPMVWTTNVAASKRVKITERHSVELRMDVVNLFNHATFGFGNQTLTSTTFGRITGFNTTGTVFAARQAQFGLRYMF